MLSFETTEEPDTTHPARTKYVVKDSDGYVYHKFDTKSDADTYTQKLTREEEIWKEVVLEVDNLKHDLINKFAQELGREEAWDTVKRGFDDFGSSNFYE